MTAFSRSRIVMLGLSTIAPFAVAIACATQPPDPDDGGENCPSAAERQVDPYNCGSCGNVCVEGMFCQAGQCSCTAPYSACGNLCLNTQGDPNNCGTCGNVCPVTAQFCSTGTCSATCAQTTCGTLCTDTSIDIRNCGACGMPCGPGQVCSGGACSCPPGTVNCGGSCMVTCASGTGGTGAGGTSTGGAAPTGGAGGAGGASGTAPTGGAAGSGTAGTGGMAVMKSCATKTVPAAALLTDFESYDGVMPLHTETGSWGFTIGPMATPAYAGLYALNDMTGMYTLIMGGGANGSARAPRGSNMMATAWGGGVGLWMGCVDARGFSGLTFWARGASPNGMLSVGLSMEDASAPDAANPAGGGTCDPAPTDGCAGPSASVALTADWTQITIPWAMFTAGRGAAGAAVLANGDEITGVSFGAQMNYVPNPADDGGTYIPEPGPYEVAIDDLGFAP